MQATVDYIENSARVTFSSADGSVVVTIAGFEREAGFTRSDSKAVREARRLMRDLARGGAAKADR